MSSIVTLYKLQSVFKLPKSISVLPFFQLLIVIFDLFIAVATSYCDKLALTLAAFNDIFNLFKFCSPP